MLCRGCAVAVVVGGAIATPAVGMSIPAGPPPATCAVVPTAQTDPADDTQRPGRWAIPPSGACAEVTRPDGTRVIELRHADGRLWAEWAHAPNDGGQTYHYPGGVILRVGPGLRPDPAATQRVFVTAAGRRAVATGSSGARPGAACSQRAATLRVRPGQRLLVRSLAGGVPVGLWVRPPERPRVRTPLAVAKQPRSRWLARWTVPARGARSGNLTFTARLKGGAHATFQVCLQVTR